MPEGEMLISIHAPHRGATDKPTVCCANDVISIHAPRGGSDQIKPGRTFLWALFQSTLPVGGATLNITLVKRRHTNFNPRSPWGERQEPISGTARTLEFQSTLPVGGATLEQLQQGLRVLFQSTLPVGGATHQGALGLSSRSISIHAPRGGSDPPGASFYSKILNFNPRSPWGERPFLTISFFRIVPISIHAPRGGSDKSICFPSQ